MSETAIAFIGIQDVDEHARRRRPWTRGLAPTALKGYGHVMAHRVPQLIDVLARQEGAVVLSRWISYFAYDFMSDMVCVAFIRSAPCFRVR
uniref:Type III effector protein gala6 n=1 Tax=Ganoderma boninense TaxID=34458 RepID=A0A5K1K555_9APHY|nr:Type III effector protein gala6 [Ganoderma boninense]